MRLTSTERIGSLALRAAGACLLATVVITIATPTPASGQRGVDAERVAAMVQSFYDRTRTVEAHFYQTYYHKLYDRYERSKGEVVFKKPGKMRWEYEKPNGKVIVSDGRHLQVFDPGQEGETPQLFVHDMDEHELPQAFSFLTGTGRIEEDFRFRLLDPERKGFTQGYVLELRPREPSPNYERVLFYVVPVGEGEAKAGVVKRVLIVDPTGNRNRFDFSEMRFNPRVSDSRFRFRPPPGTRRVRP